MNQNPTNHLDDYPIDLIDNDQVNKIIQELDPEKVFHTQFKRFDDSNDLSAELTDESLVDALEEVYKRLAYALFHKLHQYGQKISVAAMLLLLENLSILYDEMLVDEKPDFMRIVNWDLNVACLYELLSNFHSPDKALVGQEYTESEAIQSVLLKESDRLAQNRILSVTEQVRDRFFSVLNPKRLNIFTEISAGLTEHYLQLRSVLLNPEDLVLRIKDLAVDLTDELYETTEELLVDQQNLYRLIPEKFDRYSPLLEQNSLQIAQTISQSFGIETKPNLQSIWNSLVAIIIDSAKDSDEDDQLDIELPPLFANKKTKPTVN